MALPPTFDPITGQWSDPAYNPTKGVGTNLQQPALAQLASGLQGMIAQGNEADAKRIYKEKQSQYGFTDADMAPFTANMGAAGAGGFSADQIKAWKGANPMPNTLPQITAPTMPGLQGMRESQGPLDPTNALQQLLSGKIDNPYLQSIHQASINTALRGYGDAVDNVNTQVLPQIRSGAIGAGQYGGSRQGIAEGLVGQQLGRNARDLGIAAMDAGNQLYGNAYSQAQNYKFNTANALNNQAYQYANDNANRGLAAQIANANYNLGLRSSDLGFANLDANINQQNFNNRLSGANLGLGIWDRLNANNQAAVNAGTNIQNTPLGYYNSFSGLANQYGNAGGGSSSSTAMPGSTAMGGLAGWQLANTPGFRSSLGF